MSTLKAKFASFRPNLLVRGGDGDVITGVIRQNLRPEFAASGVDFARFRRHDGEVISLDEKQAKTLGTRLAAEMDRQGLTQAQLARDSGVSDATIRDMARGDKLTFRPATARKIERALGWSAGDLVVVADGGDPTPDAERPSSTAGLSGRLVDDLTPAEIRELEAFAMGLIRGRERAQGDPR